MNWQWPTTNGTLSAHQELGTGQKTSSVAITHGSILLPTVLFGVAVCILGLGLDFFLIKQERFRPMTASAILNVAFGILAAALLYKLLSNQREKHRRVLERLAVIDEMNHHIRNALQVISFSTVTASNEREVTEITRAVDRIQWSLREILPRVEPQFTPFEGSARKEAKSASFREDQQRHK